MKTKMDLLNISRVATMALIALSAAVAQAESKDGQGQATRTSAADRTEAVSVKTGKLLLKMEDLKALLGLSAQKSSHPMLSVELALSPTERAQIEAHVHQIEGERHDLAQRLSHDSKRGIARLRNERSRIQLARTHADRHQDESLQRSLYESLLREANLDSRTRETLAEFDSRHSVSIDFVEIESVRAVSAIMVGDRLLWRMEEMQYATR